MFIHSCWTLTNIQSEKKINKQNKLLNYLSHNAYTCVLLLSLVFTLLTKTKPKKKIIYINVNKSNPKQELSTYIHINNVKVNQT